MQQHQQPKSIPFNNPSTVGNELQYIAQPSAKREQGKDDSFSTLCASWMENAFSAERVLLTNSCTTALEIAATLADIQAGDEVIMPSYTYPATANAFLRRGASLKFVDIHPDTFNIDETLLVQAINERTKAIVPVHYAGVACEMDTIMSIADQHKLLIIEDAAQAFNASYNDKNLGTIGHLGAYSFHTTKNISCGEGGALVVNNTRMVERAEIIRDQGTNREKFLRGEVKEYRWVDEGLAGAPSEISAAFLYGQLEHAATITRKRRYICSTYLKHLISLQNDGLLTLPNYPPNCRHNGHMFPILARDNSTRNNLRQYLLNNNIQTASHYLPLHNSPKGKDMGWHTAKLPVTEGVSRRLLRLPLYFTLSENEQSRVIEKIFSFFSKKQAFSHTPLPASQ